MTSKHAPIDGVRMRWEERGAGTPVVLVHGIPTSPALWRHVTPLLSQARTLAWEMVGYGDSMLEGHGRDISVARQAEYLAAWLRELEIGPAILVGHDLGGGVVQIAAVRAPERCAGLVLVNSISYDSWPIAPVKAIRAAGAFVERLPRQALRGMLAPLFFLGHDDPARRRESFELHWKPYRAAGPAAFVRQVRSLDVRDTLGVAPRLSGLDVPARVVWGVADRFQPVRYGARLARDLDAPLRRIEGARHFVPEDHPAEVAAAVQELLREQGVRRAAG
ncbi:MAG TPA: alpha/beta hydrolase [Actinomycetota bacterium]|nr:alpha/beta hydrolase [Actinomycetota bacterium]